MDLLRFYAGLFAHVPRVLALLREDLRRKDTTSIWTGLRTRSQRDAYWQKLGNDWTTFLSKAKQHCEEMDLPMTAAHFEGVLGLLGHQILHSRDIDSLMDTMRRELETRLLLAVPHPRKDFYSNPIKGWESTIPFFPDAQEDVEEMNKCFALSRYTAAVFHSLLVVEHGLIALGHRVGVTDPKPGWDATYKRLTSLVNARESIPPELDFNFLEQTKARLDSMKLAWSNKVNHAAGRLVIEKTGFTDISAEEVIIACRSFMRHLAEGLPK